MDKNSNKNNIEVKVFRVVSYAFELLKVLIVVGVIFFFVNTFLLGIFRVDGASMTPNFNHGELVLVNKIAYNNAIPARGDVVVLKFPADPQGRMFVKRVIGLPGELVEIADGRVFIDGHEIRETYLASDILTSPSIEEFRLNNDEIYVIGDNRYDSNDSRFFGPLSTNHLVGKSILRFNFGLFSWVSTPIF